MPIAPSAAQIDLQGGNAHFHEERSSSPDYFDFFNAVGLSDNPRPPGQGSVWFQTFWRATGPLTQLSDPAAGFSGWFRPCQAFIEWAADEPAANLRFRSDPLSTTRTVQMGVIGHEQNGVFFTG